MFPGAPGNLLETQVVRLCHKPTVSGMERVEQAVFMSPPGDSEVDSSLRLTALGPNGQKMTWTWGQPSPGNRRTLSVPRCLHPLTRGKVSMSTSDGCHEAWEPRGRGSEGALHQQQLPLLAITVTDRMGVQAEGASPPRTSALCDLFTGTFQNGFLLKF